LPKWLPETHVRFNYADFSLEQAAGAIKARAQERGSHIQPLTPTRKAEILQAEEEFRQEKAYLLSSETAVFKEVELLFAEVEKQCEQVNTGGHFEIEHRVHIQRRDVEQFCTIGQDQVSMSLIWHQPYAGSLHTAALITREFDRLIILPPGHYFASHPNVLKEKQYLPDVTVARKYGWRLNRGGQSVISSRDFAAMYVMDFLDLLERDRAGKIRRHEQ
jgi:hypothetical protein